MWTPDVFGSICFLASSELAYAEVCHRWVCLRAPSLSWRIVALNLVGSIAFGVSAVTSLIEPSTQEPVSAAIANAGTAVGRAVLLGRRHHAAPRGRPRAHARAGARGLHPLRVMRPRGGCGLMAP